MYGHKYTQVVYWLALSLAFIALRYDYYTAATQR